jgi:pyruvate carboxylase subunit B
MRYYVTIEDRTLEVELGPDGIVVDGVRIDEAEIHAIAGTDQYAARVEGRSHRVAARRGASGVWQLTLDGHSATVDVVDERTRAIRELARAQAAAAGPRPIRAPMPGLVVRVEVAEGDIVSEGQGVVIVEAMKMENELAAETAARVRRVLVAPGDTVAKDATLIEFEALDDGDED